MTARGSHRAVAALSFAPLGDGQRATHPHPQRVRSRQGAFQSGWLLGHQPHIVDDLIEPGTGARSPVRVGRPDHPRPSGPGTTSKAGCPLTVVGIQLNPSTTRPSIAKNRSLCAARKVSSPVT
jgi:hypothetical protein